MANRFTLIALPEELDTFTLTTAAPVPPPTDPNVPADPTAPPAPAKTDPLVTYVSHTPEGIFTFSVPTYDPATTNELVAIHVALFPSPPGVPADVMADLSLVTAQPLSYSAPAPPPAVTDNLTVDASAAPGGAYTVLAVCELPG